MQKPSVQYYVQTALSVRSLCTYAVMIEVTAGEELRVSDYTLIIVRPMRVQYFHLTPSLDCLQVRYSTVI